MFKLRSTTEQMPVLVDFFNAFSKVMLPSLMLLFVSIFYARQKNLKKILLREWFNVRADPVPILPNTILHTFVRFSRK
jgi:hypothetical protein